MSSLSAIGYNIQDFLYQGTIGLFYKNKQIEKEIKQEESNENPSDPHTASSTDLVLNVADDDYKLPSVVVVGLQSSGKSTLLENITKVPIFPRSAGGICTKFPVKVVLRDNSHEEGVTTSSKPVVTVAYGEEEPKTFKIDAAQESGGSETERIKLEEENTQEVAQYIKGIMDSRTAIDKGEMVVTISGPSYAEFELIDIPGYRAGTSEDDQMTRELTLAAIAPEHALILMVVKADWDCVAGNPVWGEIQRLGKAEQTIVCLTHLDLKIKEAYQINQAIGSDEYLDTQATLKPSFETMLLPLLAHCKEDKHADVGEKVRDVVGVWNREVMGFANDVELVQMNEQEKGLFDSLSEYLLDDEKQEALIPNLPWLSSPQAQQAYRDTRPIIRRRVERMAKNIGVEQVVKKMNVFLHAYVKSAWRQKTLNRTLPVVEKTVERIKNTCGPDLYKLMKGQDSGVLSGDDEAMFRIFCESPRFVPKYITILACAKTTFNVVLNFEKGALSFTAAPPVIEGEAPPTSDDATLINVEQKWLATDNEDTFDDELYIHHHTTAADDDSLSVWRTSIMQVGNEDGNPLKTISVQVTGSTVPTNQRPRAELPKLYVQSGDGVVSQVIFMTEETSTHEVISPVGDSPQATMKAIVDNALTTVEGFLRNRIKGHDSTVILPFTFDDLFDSFVDNAPQNVLYLVNESLSWQEHHDKARSQQEHLASITSTDEMNQAVSLAAGQNTWLGGIRLKPNGQRKPEDCRGQEFWKWSDGKKWDFTDWADGEPNDIGGKEDRVHLFNGGKRFNDIHSTWTGPALYRSSIKASDTLGNLIFVHLGQPKFDQLASPAKNVLVAMVRVVCMIMYDKQKEDCDEWNLLLLESQGNPHSNQAMDIHWWTVTALLEAFYKWVQVVMMSLIDADKKLIAHADAGEFVYKKRTLKNQIELKLEAFITSVFNDHESIYKAHRFHTLQKSLTTHMKTIHEENWGQFQSALSMDILALTSEMSLLQHEPNGIRSAAAPLIDLANRFTSKIMNYCTRLQIAILSKLKELFAEREVGIFEESGEMVNKRKHLMRNFHDMSEQFTKIQKMSELFDDNDGMKELEDKDLMEMKRRLIMEYLHLNPDERVPIKSGGAAANSEKRVPLSYSEPLDDDECDLIDLDEGEY